MNKIISDLQVEIINAADGYGRACIDHARALARGDFDAADEAGQAMERQMVAVHQLTEDLIEAVRQEGGENNTIVGSRQAVT
jgi:hypothetical protein